jgi:thiol-disulfide isomerase/thioredoxin
MKFFRAMLCASLLSAAPPFVLGLELNQQAPVCPLQSLAGDTQVDLAQFKGKVVYVDFWASWCGPCALSLPFLSQLQAELGSQGFEVVAVNLDENIKDAKNFLADHPVGLSIVTAPGGQCPEKYGVQAMPSSFLFDRQGRMRHAYLGFRSGEKDDIRNHILRLLAEK